MKRELEFRAKLKGCDNWIYFDLRKEIEIDGQPSEFMMYNLDQDTVQQFIGKYDIKGKKIFEGDKVKWGHLEGAGSEHWTRVAVVEINPDIQFRILYYISRDTGERKETGGYVFRYGDFAYKDTEKFLEIV